MMKSGNSSKIIEPAITSPREPLCSGTGPFRPNVAALILRKGGREILLGERVDTPGAWQWPQGGRKKGESARDALKRELKEEIGVSDIRIIYRFPFKLRYRFPIALSHKFKPNVGQEQVYFIVKLKGKAGLARAKAGEFRRLEWRPIKAVLDSSVWFKQEVYRIALLHAHEIMANR